MSGHAGIGAAVDDSTPPLVVVGIDGSPDDEHVLRWAAGEAAVRGRPLLVTHCSTRHDAWARWLADGAAARVRDRGVAGAVHATVARGHPGAGLVGHVRAGDVLVVGSGRRPGVPGSTTQHVVRHVRGEVVVVGPPHRLAPGPWAGSVVGVVAAGSSGAAAVVESALTHGEAHRAPVVIAEVCDVPEHRTPLAAARPLSPALSRVVDSCHAAHPHVQVRRVVLEGAMPDLVTHVARGAHAVVVARGLGRDVASTGGTVVVPALTAPKEARATPPVSRPRVGVTT